MNNRNKNPKFNLEKRTIRFAADIIDFVKKIEKNNVNNPIINQLIKAGTSVGANYHEANNAQSKKDFVSKISICKKEASESEYWLTLTPKIALQLKEENDKLKQEAHELTFIFGSILSSCRHPKIS